MPHHLLSPGFLHLLRVTQASFTVLCGCFDSIGWAAAAAGGGGGGDGGVRGDPVIERLILEFGGSSGG